MVTIITNGYYLVKDLFIDTFENRFYIIFFIDAPISIQSAIMKISYDTDGMNGGGMNCNFTVIGKNRLNTIKPLWRKLNELHLKDSHFCKDHYKKFTFEERCRKFDEIDDDKIRIEIITAGDIPVGYCIATIEKSTGEIDSLFVEQEYRSKGYGGRLVENSLHWLRSKNCTKIQVAIAEGHESVFGFYQKYGFYPRMTYLQLKD